MSWLGDVFNFEKFNAGKTLQQVGKNPARLLYGSADPFSTKVWNGILGTNDKPLIDQFGGAAPQRYQEAKDAGINTGPGATMHGIARTIASFYAGGAAGNALGGAAGGAGEAGSAAMTAPEEVGLTSQAPGGLLTQDYVPATQSGLLSDSSAMSGLNGSGGMADELAQEQALASKGYFDSGYNNRFTSALGEMKDKFANQGLLDSTKDVGDAANNAMKVKNMLFPQHQRQQIQASPVMQAVPNNQLGQLVTGMENEEKAREQVEQQKRALRRQLIKGV